MDRKLLRLYAVIIITYILCVVIFPDMFHYSSKLMRTSAARSRIFYYEKFVPSSLDENIKLGEANIIFIMDDGFESQYTEGYKILKKYGMKGNVAVIPSRVGTDNYMDIGQIADLYIDGWDMLNHTYNHYELPKISEDKQIQEIERGIKWLGDNLLSRGKDILVLPGGFYDDATLKAIQAAGCESARGLENLWFYKDRAQIQNTVIHNIESTTEADWVKDWIDETIAEKGTLILINHKFEKTADYSGMKYDPDKFEEIVRYIYNSPYEINVLTYSEWLDLSNIE